jgi:hypothetical protein
MLSLQNVSNTVGMYGILTQTEETYHTFLVTRHNTPRILRGQRMRYRDSEIGRWLDDALNQ